jgi:hypothetical protein
VEIILFSHEPAYSQAAVAAGVAKVVIDWECSGKSERQSGRDTEINRGTVADLLAAAQLVGDKLICRINNTVEGRDSECKLAIENGATEIWLPMLRSVDEIEHCLRSINGLARLGVLVETRQAMQLGRELEQLPLSRAYIGLHDYRIDCGNGGLFDPVVDGSLDRFRSNFSGPLGFAGVTRPGSGSPIPQRQLLAAMVRLGCAFGVARRRFRADVVADRIPLALDEIAAHVRLLESRTPQQTQDDHHALGTLVRSLPAELLRTDEWEAACAS